MYNVHTTRVRRPKTEKESLKGEEIKQRDLALINRYQTQGDQTAFNKLLKLYTPMLRARTNGWLRRYPHCAAEDMLAAAQTGFKRAVEKFDDSHGAGIGTYAELWVRTELQAAIMASYPNITLPSSYDVKRAFFGMSRIRPILEAPGTDFQRQCQEASETFGIKVGAIKKVYELMSRKSVSIDAPVLSNGDTTIRFGDVIAHDAPTPEDEMIENDTIRRRREFLENAMEILNDREKDILIARNLKETPDTLEVLAAKWNVSRERVRQIEKRSLEKLKGHARKAQSFEMD